nr:ABC-type transport auxiliary lipoprotein family protein [Polaromonas jejuensis]
MNSIASGARPSRAGAVFYLVLAMLLLGGCSGLPDKPTRASMYDFGPGVLSTPPTSLATGQAPLPPLAIEDIVTSGGALDNMALLYRLGYADAQQLRPYAQARWSMPPAQLVRQRLREQLGQRRAVFNAGEGVALNRRQGAVLPLLLRLDLEEFSQLFTAPDSSVGLIRLRATLVEVTPAGEKLIAQRQVVAQRPAPTADAPGGVRALTAATDAAIEELDQWLQQAAVR